MCDGCGPETIHHVAGERGYYREHCMCACHDRTDEDGHHRSGAKRDDEVAAVTACARCRWAHVVAYASHNWRNDEACMVPPDALTRRPPPGA